MRQLSLSAGGARAALRSSRLTPLTAAGLPISPGSGRPSITTQN